MNDISIKTVLGHSIGSTVFTPQNPKGIVVISSATGVLQSYYKSFSLFLQENDFVVYTYDYHGIGKSNSQNIKEIKSSASDWGSNDFEAVLQHALQKNPNLPLTVIGHSIGGQLIGLAPTATKIDTILLVASQSGYWKLYEGLERYKLYLFWFVVIPLFTRIFGYLPSKKISPMESLPKNMAKQWSGWSKKPNYLFGCLKDTDLFYSKIKANIVSYSTDFDSYAPQKAVDKLTKAYNKANVTRKHLSPKKLNIPVIGHFGFFKSKCKDSIWNMFLEDIISNKLKK